MTTRRRKSGKTASKHTALWIILAIALFLIIVFLGFTYYFKYHFFFHSTINRLSVSGMTLNEAKDRLKEEAASYLLTIYDRNGEKYHITAEDIDYAYVPGEEEQKLLTSQKPYQWISSLFKKHEYTLKTTVTYNKDKLSEALMALSCLKEENFIEPTDAYIEKNETGFSLIPENPGTHLLFEEVKKEVSLAIEAGENTVTLSDQAYLAPSVKQDDTTLTDCIATLNRYLDTTITYDIADNTEILDRNTVIKWLNLNKDYSISIDQKKLTDYVQSLAYKYNTYGDRRSFLTSKGDVIEVGGGDYGWIIDKPKEEEQILVDLNTGNEIKREPVYQQRALYRESNDIGNTYVEIDYTNQHLWYYKAGTLIAQSDIVSGKLNNGNGSPDGIFKIVYRQSPAVLKGEDYESNVTFFMPFAYNVGIHDASWRSSFGKEIYKNSGSHGCVNVPYECAEAIFNNIEVGTPVIAYYREPVTLTSNSAKISNAYSFVDPEKEKQTP